MAASRSVFSGDSHQLTKTRQGIRRVRSRKQTTKLKAINISENENIFFMDKIELGRAVIKR